jgi:LysM repeat protein
MDEYMKRIEAGTHLVVLRSARRLQHYTGEQLIKTYPVAVGKKSTPTPTGNYSVIHKILNPGGVLGTRWMGLTIPNGTYGIHGTNNPSSIGKFISNGCIRMYNRDVEDLFPRVNIGTPVFITDNPDHSLPEKGAAAPPGEGSNYLIKPGDTLWKISQMYNLPLELVIQANNLTSPDVLIPGQTIFIPRPDRMIGVIS